MIFILPFLRGRSGVAHAGLGMQRKEVSVITPSPSLFQYSFFKERSLRVRLTSRWFMIPSLGDVVVWYGCDTYSGAILVCGQF
jgi:hypothetical protein